MGASDTSEERPVIEGVDYDNYYGKGVEHIGTGNYIGRITAVNEVCVFIGDGNTEVITLGSFSKQSFLFGYYFPQLFKLVSPTRIVIDIKPPFFHRVDKKPKDLTSCFS